MGTVGIIRYGFPVRGGLRQTFPDHMRLLGEFKDIMLIQTGISSFPAFIELMIKISNTSQVKTVLFFILFLLLGITGGDMYWVLNREAAYQKFLLPFGTKKG